MSQKLSGDLTQSAGLPWKLNSEWDKLFDQFLSEAPSFQKASQAQRVEIKRALIAQLRQGIHFPDEVGANVEQALSAALRTFIESGYLGDIWQGNTKLLKDAIKQAINALITESPWVSVSEREVAIWLTSCCELLGDGIELCEESWWVGLPSVSPSKWIEVGLAQELNEVKSRLVRSSGSHSDTVHGIRLSGPGRSAHLAWAARWGCENQFDVLWLDQVPPTEWVGRYGQSQTPLLVLADELHHQDRQSRWSIATLLGSIKLNPDRFLCLIWTDDHREGTLGDELAQELSSLAELSLDEFWEHDREQIQDDQEVITPQSELTFVDVLRVRDLRTHSSQRDTVDRVSDLDAYASLIGPLASLRVLADVTDLTEEGIRELLSMNGWVEVVNCPRGGGLFAPPSLSFWYAGLREGGRRAYECARPLFHALNERYRGATDARVRSILRRLCLLRGRHEERMLDVAPPSPQVAWSVTEVLAPSLADQSPSKIVLNTLCGLARDWARLGPLSGQWTEAIRALELGVAAAQRLREPSRAGLLLLSLGELALQDGRSELAETSLIASSQLLKATRRGEEACRAAQCLAEVSLLNGEIEGSLKRLKKAEVIAHELSMDREIWRCRFRRGQLFASLGHHQHALQCWSTLGSSESSGTHEGQGNVALSALAFECALSSFALQRSDELRFYLDRLSDHLPLKQALDAAWRWRTTGISPRSTLQQTIKKSQNQRDISTWLVLQRLNAILWLEELEQDDQKHQTDTMAVRTELELSIRVAAGARDRLNLIQLYRLLALIYAHAQQHEAASTASAMAEAWWSTLKLPPEIQRDEVSDVVKSSALITDEANEEVKLTLQRWHEEPMSAILKGS